MFFCFTALLGCDNGNVVIDKPNFRVLIIGDSISEGYDKQLRARKDLNIDFQHNVNPGATSLGTNAKNTRYGVKQIETWLDLAPDANMVTYNQGLWDICGALPNVPVAEYQRNLAYVVDRIKARGLGLIFFTSTHVAIHSCRLSRVKEYNDAAIEVMNAKNVPVYDLHKVSYDHRDLFEDLATGNNDHYTVKGYSIFADFIVESIKDYTGGRK